MLKQLENYQTYYKTSIICRHKFRSKSDNFFSVLFRLTIDKKDGNPSQDGKISPMDTSSLDLPTIY